MTQRANLMTEKEWNKMNKVANTFIDLLSRTEKRPMTTNKELRDRARTKVSKTVTACGAWEKGAINMPHISKAARFITEYEEKRYLGLFLDHVAAQFDANRNVHGYDLIEVDDFYYQADDLLRAIRLHEPLAYGQRTK